MKVGRVGGGVIGDEAGESGTHFNHHLNLRF